MNIKHIKTLALGLALFLAVPAMAQNKTVTGTIVDETGEPVIGATVRVPGTNIATITDLDGNYKIDAPAGSNISVSYIGYKDVVTKGGRVQLKQADTDLEEVVVVGYGVQKKAHLTGSVGTVPMDDLQDLSASSLGSTLSGLVNGLSVSGGDGRPGEAADLYIRDAKSISSLAGTNTTTTINPTPLYVIDGYIYPNDVRTGTGNTPVNLGAEAFNNLDPSEVESISVLKDAAAAVYGSRGANGVILVTTKKGKMGTPRISYSGSFGITNAVNIPTMLDSYNFGRLYNIVQARDPKNNTLDTKYNLFQFDELESMKKTNYDLIDKYWETGFTQKHSVNISGATETVNYFAGVSYFDQDGNLGNLDYNRWNYRAGVDVKISKWLSANLNVSGDYGKKNSPYISIGGSGTEDFYRLLSRPRYMPEYLGGVALYPYGISGSDVPYHYDVLQNHGDFTKNMTSNTAINAGLSYDFGWNKYLKGLKLSFSYSKSINTSKTNQYGSLYDIYQMDYRYGSAQHVYAPTGEETEGFDYLKVGDNLIVRPQTNGNFLSRQMIRTDNYQMNFTVNYARKFGKHDVSALFSIEKSEAESEFNFSNATEPYEFTNYQYTGVNKDKTKPTVNFNRSESGMMSYIGRINYAYADRYLVEFLIRSDASTKFAPKNYWGTFPTFSLGWVASEESWFRDAKWLKWIDFLKLRASYGVTGRDNIAAWQWLAQYSLDANRGSVFGEGTDNPTGGRITMNKENAAYNPDVHWSKSYKLNFGLDMRFLKQRLGVTFEAYKERNRDILLDVASVPAVVGNKSAPFNYGSMNNWGYELSLTWRDKIGKDFKYHVGLNTGYSDNKVINQKWATSDFYKSVSSGERSDVGVWGMQCMGMFRTFHDIDEYFDKYMHKMDADGNKLYNPDGTPMYGQYMGMTKDQVRPGMLIYKDVRGAYNAETGTYAGPDQEVSDDDQVQISHRSNNIYGFTINAGAEWKGLSLTLQFAANWGAYDIIPSKALSMSSDIVNMPSFWNPDDVFVYEDIYDGQGRLIQKANLNGGLPNPGFAINSRASDFWRVSAARVSLNRLTIGYTIPKNWIKPIGLQSARINITGQNLLNFYNPYPDKFLSPMSASYDRYPNLRKWTIGVNLTF